METNSPDRSSTSTCDSILKHIINCANAALQNDDAFQKSMLGLAAELRNVFDSDFCSIGIVTDGYAEDCIRSYKKFEDEELSKQQDHSLKSAKRASLDNDTYIVCQALKTALKTDKDDIFFPQEEINQFNNNEYYPSILTSGHLIDSYVFPLRDKEKKIFGYIQFINSEKDIDYQRDIYPYSDALLGLVQIIINNKKNRQEKENRLKDAFFYEQMQDKRDNVDDLLDSIMEYFSEEFNAAIISFRIPVLNGHQKEPLFYLRKYFIHQSINEESRKKLTIHYDTDRRIKKDKMNIVDKLRCDLEGTVFENESDSNFSQYGLELYNNTIIIPIFRNYDNKCIHPQRNKSEYCKENEHLDCKYRFMKLYGIFRLRISKNDLSDSDSKFQSDLDETKKRLAYLSKQITLLFNSIVEKHENESLKIFQNELKNSLFIKIKDFDERCVKIIKESVHAKVCSIYRYDEQTRYLSLSATTAEEIQFLINQMKMYFKVSNIQKQCFVSSKDTKNLISKAYRNNLHSIYVFDIYDSQVHQSPFIERIKRVNEHESALAVPMIKKDGTCAGVVLLLGKDTHKHSISTTYWEHDIDHIEFIINMLTRMSESDSERLTFLAQLSHELLVPVTELVYDNDLTFKIAERNIDSFSKRQLVTKIRENIDRNMLFKYIINDTKFIYSSTGKSIDYNIVKQEHPKIILLDAIRLLEKNAVSKGLTIRTYISEMPPLYFDKERMMQVFLNLIKNAIRYADKHTEISISYDKRDDGLHEISFADVGIGIQEEEKETIFELFYRGEEAIEKIPRGTGMGLYIVRDIMRAHGGDCYVRRLENPTEFAITLPNKE